MLKEAINYMRLGWPIFPVVGKRPAIKNWKEKATIDETQLSNLFKTPHTGIALATGKASGITVVDVDNKNGVNGFLTLEKLGIELPSTVSVYTPSGGRQYYYKYNPALKNLVGALGEGSGIDIRNDGGLVVMPPSMHPNGGKYDWLSDQAPGEIEIADFPDLLLKTIKGKAEPIEVKTEVFRLPEIIVQGERNNTLFRYACKLRSTGLEEAEISSLVKAANVERCVEPIAENEVKSLVESACRYERGAIERDKNGTIKRTMLNVTSLLGSDQSLNGLFYFNLFTGDIHYSRTPSWSSEIKAGKCLDDRDIVFIKHYLATNYRTEFPVPLIQEAIFINASINQTHPVRSYLDSLIWDGKPRLANWLTVTAGVVDNPYTTCVGIKTLVAAVARVKDPGCKFDHMLVLEGPQGIGKGLLTAILGGQWFSEINITGKEKDVVEIMRGNWILEVSEMVCMNMVDVAHLKAFITRKTDRVRLAYRRNAEDFQRQCIFIGTINPEGDNTYLRDSTGNRRFWPVKCTRQIDQEWLKINRDQLFAEAVVRYKAGEKLWIDSPEVEEIVKNEQEIRQSKDIWTKPIWDYVSPRGDEISANDIIKDCLHIEIGKATKSEQTRIGIIMGHFGWTRKYDKRTKCSLYVRTPSNNQAEG